MRSAPAREDARPFPSEAPEGDAPARGPLSPFSLLWIKSLEEKERLPLEVSAQTPPAAIFRACARHAAGGGCRATAQADLLHLRLRTHAYLSMPVHSKNPIPFAPGTPTTSVLLDVISVRQPFGNPQVSKPPPFPNKSPQLKLQQTQFFLVALS